MAIDTIVNHWKIPWRIGTDHGRAWLANADNIQVAEFNRTDPISADYIDRAKFAAVAINSHDALVAALEELADWVELKGFHPPAVWDARLALSAALAAAKV